MHYLLLAFIAGVILPVQAGLNGALSRNLGHPVLATFISFLVGTLALGLYAAVARLPWPQTGVGGIEVWKWVGGFMGALYLTLVVLLTPKLGTATTFGLVIAGQLVASVVLDHFGWFGLAVHHINAPRVAGVGLLLAGVYLVRNY